ncbi:Non-specific lipid-transfer protein 1 [Apostasia shenzhenica]|uniref:Non-specific lipid-transfer protein n=1 Tax=Apostasia shenzhenica TaxID=1088818 RepID=A0A2I0AQ16_9ASPA|nr:Non-specific lipid-transfer protein 1 [Apostasia shenzhenica]
MGRSAAPTAAAFLLAVLLLAGGAREAASITCGQVASTLAPCIPYLRGSGPANSACCNGVRSLNAAAQTTADRQTACNCLKTLSASISGLNLGLAAGLPGKCGVNVPYRISPSTDCSR